MKGNRVIDIFLMQETSKITAFQVEKDVWMVPCLVNRSTNFFTPLSKPFCSEIDWEKIHTRQPWLPVEDEHLKMIAETRNKKNWSRIASELNAAVHKGLPIRLGKQCRERYFNHLDPCLNKGKWDRAEDTLIIKKQRTIGNRWSEIARFLPGRTENQIKNRFKSLIKKTPKGVDPLAVVSEEEICFSSLTDRIEAGIDTITDQFERSPSPSYLLCFGDN